VTDAPNKKLDFSSIEGHQLHLQEPKDAIAITDGIEVFSVPRKYVAAILKAVPELRYSFEHLGGQHQETTKKLTENTKYATAPWQPSHTE
jgi:hypothetical protein